MSRAKPAVVLVDDNEDHRLLTRLQLRRLAAAPRFLLQEAENGPEALVVLSRLAPSGRRILLLTDYRMPEMTGSDLIEEVRRRWPAASVRGIVVTSVEQAIDLKDRNALRADDLLVKVFDVHEYRRRLERIVDGWLGETP